MNRKLNLLGALMLVLFALSSCKKEQPAHSNYIPADALVVSVINPVSIAKKYPDISKLFDLNLLGGKGSLKIAQSGMDLLSDIYVFGDADFNKKSGYVGVCIKLLDKDKFEEALKKDNTVSPPKSEEGIQISEVKYEGQPVGVLGWNDGACIVILNPDNETGKTETSKALLKKLFTQKPESSIYASNAKFKALKDKENDLSIWVNLEKLAEMPEYKTMLQMANCDALKSDPKGSAVALGINFDKGQLLLEGIQYGSKADMERSKKIMNKGLNAAVVNDHAGANPKALMATSLNFSELYTMFKPCFPEGAEAGINRELSEVMEGLTAEKLTKTITGDIIISLNDYMTKTRRGYDDETEGYVDMTYSVPTYAFSLGIKDKLYFSQILDGLVKKKVLDKKDGLYLGGDDVVILVKDNSVTLQDADSYAASDKGGKLPTSIKDLVNKSQVLFWANQSALPNDLVDEEPMAKQALQANETESFTLTAQNDGDDYSSLKLSIAFKNKNENVLAGIQRMITAYQKLYDESLTQDKRVEELSSDIVGEDALVPSAPQDEAP